MLFMVKPKVHREILGQPMHQSSSYRYSNVATPGGSEWYPCKTSERIELALFQASLLKKGWLVAGSFMFPKVTKTALTGQ